MGGPHPVLSACRDLHPGGRREPSPQSSRVFLSSPPVQAVSVFRLERRCWRHALGLLFAPLQMHRAARLRGHPVGNRHLLVLVPGPRACLTPLRGSRFERRTGACHLPLLEKDDYFFPAQRQLENRKSTKCCWLLLPMPVPSGGH